MKIDPLPIIRLVLPWLARRWEAGRERRAFLRAARKEAKRRKLADRARQILGRRP